MPSVDSPGRAQAVQVLQRSLARGRLAHAYLLVGSDPNELELIAGSLARTLNCSAVGAAAPSRLDGCGACSACRRIEDRTHPDVGWLRPESRSRSITVDQVRDAMRTVNLKPVEARYKVTVVVAADRLNVSAANAFLKTLEEPPPQSIFLLLTTEPRRLLETVLSRCLRLNLSDGGVARRLGAREREWLAAFGEAAASPRAGTLGRYQLLGRLLDRLAEIRADVEKRLGDQSPLGKYDDLDPELRARWEKELDAATESEYRRQRADLLGGVQDWLRDVWLRTLVAPGGLCGLPELGPATEALGGRLTPQQAVSNLELLEELHSLLNSNVQESLALEVSLLRLSL